MSVDGSCIIVLHGDCCCVIVRHGDCAEAFDVVALTSPGGHGEGGAAPDDDAPESSDTNALRSSRALNSGVIAFKSLARSA